MGQEGKGAAVQQYGGATTINEVLEQLEDIIQWSIREKSRIGYFASLYQMVTFHVKKGIEQGDFEDGPRMERLDVIFANRYLDALDAYLHHKPTSACWDVAFRYVQQRRPIILQHLLAGMNAHINYDLGIAAAETSPGDELPALYNDFLKINDILASLVNQVRAEIDQLSPWINVLDHIGSKSTEVIINFSMKKARDFAWDFATLLANQTRSEQEIICKGMDQTVAGIGQFVVKPPGMLLRIGLWIIRLRESGNVVHNIEVLHHPPVQNVKWNSSVSI